MLQGAYLVGEAPQLNRHSLEERGRARDLLVLRDSACDHHRADPPVREVVAEPRAEVLPALLDPDLLHLRRPFVWLAGTPFPRVFRRHDAVITER